MMKRSISSFPRAMLLGLIGSTLIVAAGAAAGASSYFSSLASDEKEDYTNWLADHSSSYSRHEFMAGEEDGDGAAIFWTIDNDAQTIHLAAAVHATGWVGFGISEAGGMIGSDMALFQASQPTELIDAYVVDQEAMPLTDSTCQDWTLKSSPIAGENGWIIVEMSRLLDTQDTQDHVLKNDADLWRAPTRIIAAWGDDTVLSYHGKKKARSAVRLFATDSTSLEDVLSETSDGYFDVLQEEFEIPSNETYYHSLCKTYDELSSTLPEGQSNVTMIGAIPVIDQVSAVHHYEVFLQSECNLNLTDAVFLTRTLLYAWAPGDQGLALPDDVGFPLFDNENTQAISIEIHYNNPSHTTGMLDSSGLRVYYINEERTYRAGVYSTGDPFVALMEIDPEINDGLTKHTFTCPGECSSLFLASETERSGEDAAGVTIILESLHMHQTGVRMTNEVIRNGEVFHKAVVDVYDFEQQGSFSVPQEQYTVLPGDSFRTTCYYEDGSQWGMGSADEMCITFMMYFPVKKLSTGLEWYCNYGFDLGTGCVTELEQADLNRVEDLGRSFGATSGECVADTPSTTSSTKSPTTSSTVPPPTVGNPTSGTIWLGVTFIVPVVTALFVIDLM